MKFAQTILLRILLPSFSCENATSLSEGGLWWSLFTGSKQQLHGWQANKKHTCAQPVVLGLCTKLKYPSFIIFSQASPPALLLGLPLGNKTDEITKGERGRNPHGGGGKASRKNA